MYVTKFPSMFIKYYESLMSLTHKIVFRAYNVITQWNNYILEKLFKKI